MSMISPEIFAIQYKNESYEKLLKIRDEFIRKIRHFEKHDNKIINNNVIINPSPELQYKMNIEYLIELLILISEKYQANK